MSLLQPAPLSPAASRPGASAAQSIITQREDRDRALVLHSLTKRWSNVDSPVLDGLDLCLQSGTVTWIGGRNGAGKTTMLRIAAGLIEPDAGIATVTGLTARQHRARYQRLVSFLPAGDRGLYARLSVRQQLEFWSRISMVASARVGELVSDVIAEFALTDLAAHRVDRMSMGQRQRLRLAMTFMTGAKVVLLDEPLTSLDAEGAALVFAAVERVRGDGGTVLWCSPTGEQPALNLDAAWLLDRGRLIAP